MYKENHHLLIILISLLLLLVYKKISEIFKKIIGYSTFVKEITRLFNIFYSFPRVLKYLSIFFFVSNWRKEVYLAILLTNQIFYKN